MTLDLMIKKEDHTEYELLHFESELTNSLFNFVYYGVIKNKYPFYVETAKDANLLNDLFDMHYSNEFDVIVEDLTFIPYVKYIVFANELVEIDTAKEYLYKYSNFIKWANE